VVRLSCVSRGSSVSTVSGYGLDDWAVEVSSPAEAKGLFLCLDLLWCPPNLLHNGYRGPFPGAKARLERDADHSSPSSVEVENE
jgi:hypothetical protein